VDMDRHKSLSWRRDPLRLDASLFLSHHKRIFLLCLGPRRHIGLVHERSIFVWIAVELFNGRFYGSSLLLFQFDSTPDIYGNTNLMDIRPPFFGRSLFERLDNIGGSVVGTVLSMPSCIVVHPARIGFPSSPPQPALSSVPSFFHGAPPPKSSSRAAFGHGAASFRAAPPLAGAVQMAAAIVPHVTTLTLVQVVPAASILHSATVVKVKAIKGCCRRTRFSWHNIGEANSPLTMFGTSCG